MPVNLINEKDLNNYLADIVYHGQEMETFKSGDFKSTAFVEQNKDAIVRSMLLQWCKHRLRSHLAEDLPEHQDFLAPIKADEPDLPAWAERCLAQGNPIHRFEADKIPATLTENVSKIRDYLYSAAESYVNKTLARVKDTNAKGKEQISPKLRIDYLKTQEIYDTFAKTLVEAEKWHNIIAQKAELRKRNEEMYQASLAGTHSVMKWDNGMEIVQLTTPEALDYESEYMGHCVGEGDYDSEVEAGELKIYSLRDADGMPHVTLQVGTTSTGTECVCQCKGKADKAPVARYRPYIQEFIIAKKFIVTNDQRNTGLIKLYDEATRESKYYDLFNIPKGKRFICKGGINLSRMELTELPDLSNVIIEGSFDCSQNHLTSLKGAPYKVKGFFACSSNNLPSLEFAPQEVEGNFDCCLNNELDTLKYVSVCKEILSDIDVYEKYGIPNHYENISEYKPSLGQYNRTYYRDLIECPLYKAEKKIALDKKREVVRYKIKRNEAAKNVSPIKEEIKPKRTGKAKVKAKINIMFSHVKQMIKR